MPKIVQRQPKEGELDDIVNKVKKVTITIETEFPSELDNLSDVDENDDPDDIIGKFDHDGDKEFNDLFLYRDISQKCSDYLKNIKILKLTDKQKKSFRILVNKIYIKLIIYSHEIVLNKGNPIYESYDDKAKDLIFQIGRLVNKLINIINEKGMLNRGSSFKKNDLNLFFNNSIQLFKFLIEVVDYLRTLQTP